MAFQLTMTALKPEELPSEDEIIAAGYDLMSSMTTDPAWKDGKHFTKYNVKSIFRPKRGPYDGANWHARVSEHGPEDATFDQFWKRLGGEDKAEYELEFIPDIKKVTKIKTLSPNALIVSMFYHLTPPLSPRVFTVVQVRHFQSTAPRTGLVVSIPIDLTDDPKLLAMEEKGVRGRYVSVEKLTELPNGKVEWRMATSNTAGGNVPQFIADRAMPSAIAEDIPHFLKWFHAERETKQADSEVVTLPSAPAIISRDETLNQTSSNNGLAEEAPTATGVPVTMVQ